MHDKQQSYSPDFVMFKLFTLSHLDNCISNFLADSGGTTALWEPSYMDEWHSV
jgi:hypothetical protein